MLVTNKTIELTQNEKRYKEKVWSQMMNLLTSHNALPTEHSQVEVLKLKLSCEIDEQILIARQAGKTPEEMEQERCDEINNKNMQIRDIELNGYTLDVDAFWEKFETTLHTVSFFPAPTTRTFGGTLARNAIYDTSSAKYAVSSSACSQLMGICDTDAVLGFTKALRDNYETLRRSKMLGYTEIHAVKNRHVCDLCKRLEGAYLSTDGLLSAYETGILPFPHELPWEDQVRWCSGPKLIFAPNDDFGLR